MNSEMIWKAALVIGVTVLGAISYMFMGGKKDNPVEEHSEKIIYHYTGIDVDLSPHSPEGDGDEEWMAIDLNDDQWDNRDTFDAYDMILTTSKEHDGNK
ncbi:MAG: hypothetical protein R3230_01515 [Nitrosopumilaceae archaeon]|nr:hypothetical protein [Nitrosopumilaceae archaeon]